MAAMRPPRGARSMAGVGHQDPFPPHRLNARCPLSEGTLAGTHGNGRDARQGSDRFRLGADSRDRTRVSPDAVMPCDTLSSSASGGRTAPERVMLSLSIL